MRYLQTAIEHNVIQGNMQKIVTKVKRGRRIKEVNFPENILTLNHANMSLVQVRSVLVRVILAERKSNRINNNRKLMPYIFKLRNRRLQLAQYFSSQGGKVSPLLFRSRLPTGIKWPGIIGLVETKPYESKLITNV
jgi:hypothetical protein